MKIRLNFARIATTALLALALLAVPTAAFAHCDTMDGPVVLAAEKALETGELEPMLIWVREIDEPEIRHAFEHVQTVRALGGDAASLADRFFFETVVRIHREGEGEPYTGLKPAGTDLGEAVPAGDRALETGSVEELRETLHGLVDNRLDVLFVEAHDRTGFSPTDVAAGRAYVKAYVELMHFGEQLEALVTAHGHAADAEPGAPHAH